MNTGRPGPLEDFLTGFVTHDGSGGRAIERWGRPVGVTQTPNGSLLISDDGGNRIWKVSAARR
jgi:glucose/arabinose dehydrogenase